LVGVVVAAAVAAVFQEQFLSKGLESVAGLGPWLCQTLLCRFKLRIDVSYQGGTVPNTNAPSQKNPTCCEGNAGMICQQPRKNCFQL
jgi:hypothetical protein